MDPEVTVSGSKQTGSARLVIGVLATNRLLSATRTRDAWWLAMWMTVMAYSSGYLVVFGAIMIAVAVLTRIPEWRSRFYRWRCPTAARPAIRGWCARSKASASTRRP